MIRLLAALLACPLLLAQEVAGVHSPDGQIAFVLDVAQPQDDPAALAGLAYQVRYKGQLLIDTSYLGFDVWAQEPLLGEKVGLSAAKNTEGPGFNKLYAEFLQQGSLGRRIHIEARVYNTGIAFRYVIPPSAPLMDILFRDEITEFRLAGKVTGLSGISATTELTPPFLMEIPGLAWVAIHDADAQKPFHLRRYNGNTLVLRMPRLTEDPSLVVKSHPTWTSSWRVLLVGSTEMSVRTADFLSQLPKKMEP